MKTSLIMLSVFVFCGCTQSPEAKEAERQAEQAKHIADHLDKTDNPFGNLLANNARSSSVKLRAKAKMLDSKATPPRSQRIEDVTVEIVSYGLQDYSEDRKELNELKDGGQDVERLEELLDDIEKNRNRAILLKITNHSETKKLRFWGGMFDTSVDFISDEFGNDYSSISGRSDGDLMPGHSETHELILVGEIVAKARRLFVIVHSEGLRVNEPFVLSIPLPQ
jgi:hypothetical protein